MFNKEMNSNVLKPETLSFEYCEAIGTLSGANRVWVKWQREACLKDAIQDFFVITKLVFWSAAQIQLDLKAAVHI